MMILFRLELKKDCSFFEQPKVISLGSKKLSNYSLILFLVFAYTILPLRISAAAGLPISAARWFSTCKKASEYGCCTADSGMNLHSCK